MNLLAIRTETRRYIAEKSSLASYSTDADISSYINEGIKDMCIKGRVYERVRSVTTLNGVAAYTLPLDFLSLHGILSASGNTATLTDASRVGALYIVTGKPLWYYIAQTTITTLTRVNNTSYAFGDIVVPVTANGYLYEVTVTGVSAAAPPVYPTNPGTEVIDGTVSLVCREMATSRYYITFIDTPTTVGGGVGTYVLTYYALDEGLWVDTDSPNFPQDKHHILVIFATFRHFYVMKDMTRANAIYLEYSAALGLQPPGQGGK